MLMGGSFKGWGQIAAWDFNGESSPATSAADVYDANLSSSNLITRGAGASASTASNSFRTTGFQNNGINTSNTDYFQITIGAAINYQVSLTSITARYAGTSSFYASPGVTSQYAYSLDGSSFTLIGSPVTSTSLTPSAIDLSGISALQNVTSGTTITIRYYASGQTTTGGWGYSSPSVGQYGLAIGGTVTSTSNTAPTVTTQAPTAVLSTTATGNGNITATGGVAPTTRGFCWDLASNADPDVSDSKVEETGTFSTGAFTGSITGLTAGTQYKVRAYAINTVGTSYGGVQSFYTLSTEPSAHAASFSSSTVSQTQIDLTFSAASTITTAAGYLVLQRTAAAPTGSPADGSAYSVGNAIGDGTVAAVITNTAATTASITGLSAGTQYYFTLIPFNWDGATNTTYNYKTDGVVPGTNTTTTAPLDVTSKVEAPAAQTAAGNITSIATASGAAVEVFKFKISDLATSDAVATKVTQVQVKKSSGTADWTDHIAGAELWDGASQITTGTVVITDSDITFPISSGNLDIASGSNKDIAMKIWLNTTNIVDNSTMVFSVSQTSHGFTADASASTFAPDFGAAVTGNTMTISVVATKLKFVQQPTNTSPNVAMSPVVTVETTDANNNRDLDYITDINITSSGTLTASPVAGTPVSGLASFSTLTHAAIESNLTLTATSGSLIDAVSNTFAISNVLLVEDFDYLDGQLLTANGWAAHSGSGTAAIDVTSAGLSFNGYVGSGIGGAARVDNSGEDVNKAFAAKTSGVLYVASMIQINANTAAGYFFHLGPNVIGSTFFSRIWVNSDANGINITNGNSAPSSYISITNGVPFVIVLKHNFATHKTDMFILNSFTPNEPVTPNVTIDEVISEIGSVALRQFSSSQSILVDGIRVSTSWSDLPITFSGTGEWTETARWNTGSVPATTQSIVVDGMATINSNENIGDITINSGKSLSINADKQLTISSTLTNNAAEGIVLKSPLDHGAPGSLIVNGSISGSGTIKAERYIQAYSAAGNGWHLISSPVNSVNIASGTNLAPGGTDDLYAFNETAYEWTNYKPGNVFTTMENGKGYLVSYAAAATKQFVGTPNNAAVTFTNLSKTAGEGNGWHLIGNPFQSAISWNNGGWTLTNIGGVAKRMSDAGSYTDVQANDIIPAMQGFFVQAENATNTLTIPLSARTHNSAQNWTKSGNANSLLLVAHDPAQAMYQESRLNENPAATEAYDYQYDSRFVPWYAPEFYSISGNEQLSTNSIPDFSSDDVIPFGFKKNGSAAYYIELKESPAGLTTYLTDTKTGIEHNFADNAIYSFTAAEGDSPTRFLLHFGAVGVSEQPESSALKAYVVGGQLYFPLQGEATLQIVDLQGRVLQQSHVAGQGLTSTAMQQPAGAYVVRLVGSHSVQTAKVIVK